MREYETSLDMSTLRELREMLDEGLDELLTEYLDDTASQLENLHHAVAGADHAAIASISHALKGSSGNLGVRGISTLCHALEQEAKSGAVADAAASLQAIEAAFETAKEELAAFMVG
jgi:HPt (histidine-containing phosphotransfer) domain-containing protein